MKRKVTIEEAIELLQEQYIGAVSDPHVNDPVAYALYYTWREVDERNRRAK